ncbi:hypothetical protein BUALT_Bualt08G0002100 [Buddleja alternifolia]|uniref:Proton pump-interactor 1 n=1 Tax=Buddleja alternifolia TaxID=168488 RepID=A0AAV6X959_9LAMI|nr:hypothetical protein BUALT_Bualt08G0002100 [Buddleja alternifolia]
MAEMGGVEEKCGLDMSCYEDLPKPDCKGAKSNNNQGGSDPDNSYVFVIGDDGFSDDAVGNKEDVAVEESSRVLQVAAVPTKDQLGPLKLDGDQVHVHSLDHHNGKAEADDINQIEDPSVNIEISVGDQLGKTESYGEAEIKQVEDPNIKNEITGEAAIKQVEDPNRKIETSVVTVGDQNERTESLGEAAIKQVEDPSPKVETSAKAATVMVGDQNGNIESLAEAEIRQVEDPSPKVEISEAATVIVGDQHGKIESLGAEAEIKQVEDPSRNVETSAEAVTVMVGDESGKIEEAEIKQVEDLSPDVETSAEAATVMVGDENGKSESWREPEIKQVEDPNTDFGMSAEAAIEMGGDQNGKTKSVAEAEVEQVEDPNKKVEISTENEVENVGDQCEKIEDVVKVEDPVKSESYPGPVENQESQVEALELVSESRENEEINNVSSNIDKYSTSKYECEGQIYISAIESTAVDVIECGSWDMNVEGEDEIKLAREIVGKVEIEVPLVTPLDSAQESYPICNKEDTLDDEENKALDINVIENKNCDTALGDNVQGELKQIETQIGVNSTNLEDKDEDDLSVSCIDDGVQYPESIQSETKTEVSVPSGETQTMIEISNAENIEEVSSSPVDSPKSQIIHNGLTGLINCTANEESLGSETILDTVVCTQKEPTFQGGEVHAETEEVSSGKVQVENSPPATFDVKLVPEADVHNSSAISSGESTSDVTVSCTTKVLDSFDVNNEGETKDVEKLVDQKEPTLQTEVSSGETEVAKSPLATFVAKLEPEVDVSNVSAISRGDTDSDVTVVCTTDVLDGFDVNNEDDTKDVEKLGDQKEPSFQTEVSSGKTEVGKIPPATVDVKLKPEADVNNVSSISRDPGSDVTVVCKIEALDSVDTNIEGETKDVDDTGDQLDGAVGSSNEKLFLQENEDTGKPPSNNISVIDGGDETSVKTKTKPFNFLIRVPRFDDESLREQIRLAKLHVDEKTKLRDAIQGQIQEIRANSQIHGVDYEYAKGEGRNARKLVRSKRMEIDSLQSVINKAKNALSVEDIDSQIYNMEHMIQHETLPLKEEKQLIREIKQLKQLREQLSSNMGNQDEIKQALEQREEIEERLKILRKELDVLKNSVLKAEAAAVQAERKYEDENKKVKELQTQFRAANDVRQAAYVEWQNLRKELSMKNAHFFRYKDDSAVAGNYAFSRDTEALYRLCTNHVENFMELWNTNEEFRKDYVKFNARSTVRRLGTLDGRSLGPDEEPPILPSYFNERVNRMVSKPAKIDSVSPIPTPELKQETKVKIVTSDDKSMKKVTEHKNQKVTNKEPIKIVQGNGLETMSSREVDEEVHEEPKKSKEEIELIKKAEEKRKEEAEAKLKEQRRLEGLAKAKEARERKKRQAEKLQLRAELKTQKEAELKEKEREKRLRKKERKKAAATDVNDITNNSESAPSSETTIEIIKDIEVKDTSTAITKKPQKPWLFTKQSKTKSIPPPLRNRSKKKWQQWMWMGFTCIVIFALFWLGNIGVFSNMNLRRRGPIH